MAGDSTPGVDLEALVKSQAAQIARLEEQMFQMQARVPLEEPEPVPGLFQAFPRTVYKKGGKAGQVDHPGNVTKTVRDQGDFDAHLLKGWSADPHPFAYDEPAEKSVAKPAGKK